jgi:long-chain fatty acid transport protein
MKKWLVGLSLMLIGIMLFSPSRSFASGFALPEQGSAAMGMASAFVAQADDASAVWYNPAAITRLDGTQVAVGATFIYPSFKHETVFGTTEAPEHKLFYTIMLYGTQKLSDRVSLGLGINNPFGLSTTWSPASSTAGVATLSSVKTINTNPNIAFKISDDLSIAVGADYMYLDATLSSLALSLTGDGDGWGANASILYRATDKLNLGLSYRSKIKVDIDGTAFGMLPAETSITLPDEYKLGISYRTSDTVTLNAEADLTNWSTYNQIEVPSLGLVDPKEWMDTWCYRLGGQYQLSDAWKLRLGLFYDQNPIRDEYFETRVPIADRYGFTLGTGHSLGKMTVDVAYMYLQSKDRTINDSIEDLASQVLNGTYKSSAHIANFTVGYKF